MLSKVLGGVRKVVSGTVERAREALPSLPRTRPDPRHQDSFGPARFDAASARRLGFGLPDIDLPGLDDIKDAVGDAVDSVKDKVGGFLSDVKDAVVRGGVEALFKALEALPGEVDQADLDRLMDIGGVKAPSRSLTAEERAALEPIYGDSIDYEQVRVREGDIGLFNRDDRPLVLGNTILVPEGRLDPDTGRMRPDDFVHEAAHIWQYQHGGIDYIKQSLQDQGTGGSGAYDISGALENHTPWEQLRTEQQASLIELALEEGYFEQPEGERRFVVDGVDHTAYLESVLEQVHGGYGAPGGPTAPERREGGGGGGGGSFLVA